jgi:hypothetical protein
MGEPLGVMVGQVAIGYNVITNRSGTRMNWIGALFMAALITIAVAIHSDMAMTRCEAKSFSAWVGLCSPGFK